MARNRLFRPAVARLIVALQVLPLVALRPAGYSISSQEWWLPALLAALALVSAAQVLFRGTHAPWPWHLFSLAQGFNIISKLMMLMPHASVVVDGVQRLDVVHLALSVVSMALSASVIWYCEQPDVRNLFLAATPDRAARDGKTIDNAV